MQTTVYHTSQKLEKDQVIPLYILKDGKREVKLCRVMQKHKEGSVGECFMYSLEILP